MFRKKLEREGKNLLDEADIERLDKIFARHSDKVSYKIVESKAALLNLETGKHYSLDEVGTVMWESFDGNKSLLEVASETARQFGVGRRNVGWDLAELANGLMREGLVELRYDVV